MKKKTLGIVVILLAVLATAIPALAHAPAQGTVVEGVSVPGIALGESRAQVDDVYGHPASCTYSTSATCSYNADGGGQVNVTFRAPDGGPAQDSPSDVATMIGWETGVTGWVTTAGIDITIARDDPQALLDAYPNAEVTYWYDGTFVAGVRDWQSGISISRWWEFYCGCAVATMAIFHPQDPPPEPEPVQYTYVADIDLTAVKIRKTREITAQVLVNDRQHEAVEGATVIARWHLPDGSQQNVQAITSGSGTATFTLFGKLQRGTYYLFIDDVQFADHFWNDTGGVRDSSIYVK